VLRLVVLVLREYPLANVGRQRLWELVVRLHDTPYLVVPAAKIVSW